MPDPSTAPTCADQALVERSLDVIESFWAETFTGPCPRDRVRNVVARYYATWTGADRYRSSRNAAAIHEAAHFAAMHVEGFGARHARIYNRDGNWNGEAASLTAPGLNNPHSLIRKARATLAGPLAEELLGDAGNEAIADCFEEFLHAGFIVKRAAMLWGQSNAALWQSTVIEAAALVEFWTAESCDIAAVLARRKIIHAQDRPIRRILARVSAKSLTIWKFSPRCMDILTSVLPLASSTNERKQPRQ
jgi:hypothetical protein